MHFQPLFSILVNSSYLHTYYDSKMHKITFRANLLLDWLFYLKPVYTV